MREGGAKIVEIGTKPKPLRTNSRPRRLRVSNPRRLRLRRAQRLHEALPVKIHEAPVRDR